MKFPVITSRQNPKIALFRAIMRSKKAREQAGVFAVEGGKLFCEAVNSGLEPTQLLMTEKFSQKNNELIEKAANLCNIDIISNDLAEYISDTKSPEGVFFTIPLPAPLDKSVKLNTIKGVRLIALDGLQEPGNVGAMIRSCDAFGIDGLLMSETCADIYSPKVIRSAMGSSFRLPVCRGELTEFLTELKSKGFVLIGAGLSESAERLGNFTFPEKCVAVIGNEGAGISREVLNLCDAQIYIPVKNVESLNAAVAASIIIYEMSANCR
ncbi:MAG: RNA methyltransferase [Oscillospiraceae bacterium]|nr:RNA methyltransferase [Oscillospiraceae bacterium]